MPGSAQEPGGYADGTAVFSLHNVFRYRGILRQNVAKSSPCVFRARAHPNPSVFVSTDCFFITDQWIHR